MCVCLTHAKFTELNEYKDWSVAKARITVMESVYSLIKNLIEQPNSIDNTANSRSNTNATNSCGLITMISQSIQYQQSLIYPGVVIDPISCGYNHGIVIPHAHGNMNIESDTLHYLYNPTVSLTNPITVHRGDGTIINNNNNNNNIPSNAPSININHYDNSNNVISDTNTAIPAAPSTFPGNIPVEIIAPIKVKAAVAWTVDLPSDSNKNTHTLPAPPQRKADVNPPVIAPTTVTPSKPPRISLITTPIAMKKPAVRTSKWYDKDLVVNNTLLYTAPCPVRCAAFVQLDNATHTHPLRTNTNNANVSTVSGSTSNQQQVVIGTNDKSLIIMNYNHHSSAIVREYKDIHKGSVYCCDTYSLSNDITLIASGSNDKYVKITKYVSYIYIHVL